MRGRVLVLLALTVVLGAPGMRASAGSAPASPLTILTIHSGTASFPANPILDAGIREAIASRSDLPIDYFTEYFDSNLGEREEAGAAFRDYLKRKYHGRRIDVVFAMTDVALRFVLDHREDLFLDVPIVFFGLAAPDVTTRGIGAGLTGITAGLAYEETLNLALTLHPSTRRVFVVARGSDDSVSESVRTELRGFSSRVSLTFLNEETVPLLLSAVRAVPPESIILYIWHFQPDPGNARYPDAVARLVADAAPVPVYGTSDFYIGTGVVGGVVRRTQETGNRLGWMALRVLTGTRAQDIPLEVARVAPVIDWRQVERWGIDPSRLPGGSEILFREPSAWERDKPYIVVAVVILLAQAALITGLTVQRVRRRKAEQQLRRSQTALAASYDRIRDLGSRLLTAHETERSRIARELHDDVSQQLAVLAIDLTLLRRAVQGGAEGMATEALKRTDSIAVSVRDLSHHLHPEGLRMSGLVRSLDGLVREMEHPEVTITFTHDNIPPTLPADLTVALFRIVQEALQNALKYSKARTVTVDLRAASDDIVLRIVDDGVGFDVDAAWGKGLGLISVDERVKAVGGRFEMRSSPGVGTTIEVRVPVSDPRESQAIVA